MQKLAPDYYHGTDYYHLEVGVESVDSACFGRNYFNSFASEGNIDEHELKRIFAEAAALKKLAQEKKNLLT